MHFKIYEYTIIFLFLTIVLFRYYSKKLTYINKQSIKYNLITRIITPYSIYEIKLCIPSILGTFIF